MHECIMQTWAATRETLLLRVLKGAGRENPQRVRWDNLLGSREPEAGMPPQVGDILWGSATGTAEPNEGINLNDQRHMTSYEVVWIEPFKKCFYS